MSSQSLSKPRIEHPSPVLQRLGAWLRALRRSRDLPLRVVAAAAEMDTALLSKIELGQRLPTEKQAIALANFFAVSTEELQAKRIADKFWTVNEDTPATRRAARLITSRATDQHSH